MRLPVDTSVTHFVPAGPSKPVVDFDTKQPKVDRRTRGGGPRMTPVLTPRVWRGRRRLPPDMRTR